MQDKLNIKKQWVNKILFPALHVLLKKAAKQQDQEKYPAEIIMLKKIEKLHKGEGLPIKSMECDLEIPPLL